MAKSLVIGQRERVSEWVAPRVGRATPWYGAEGIGLEQDGELIAGAVFDGYVPRGRMSLHVAVAHKHAANKEFLLAMFDYPFRQLGVNVLLNPVGSKNEVSLKATKHLGFDELVRIPGGSGDEDLVLFLMRRENCKWVSEEVRKGLHLKQAA